MIWMSSTKAGDWDAQRSRRPLMPSGPGVVFSTPARRGVRDVVWAQMDSGETYGVKKGGGWRARDPQGLSEDFGNLALP